MGRKGNDIYDSDDTKDYLLTVTGLLERELAYWVSPELTYVKEGAWWLARVLSVFEAILLLEQYYFDSSVFLFYHEKSVPYWREVFFKSWEGEWVDDKKDVYLYSDPQYRKQHRPAVAAIFDHLESVAYYWAREYKDLKPLLATYSLPYFSIRRGINFYNQEVVSIDQVTRNLISHLEQDIIYWLSPEKRSEAISSNVEEVWAATDLLSFLCEAYEQPPGINDEAVNIWRSTTVEIWKKSGQWREENMLYQNVMRAFDKLEATARKYPPWW